MKNKIVWHQIVLVLALVLLTVGKIISGKAVMGIEIIWWWLGAVLGFVFVFGDRLVHLLVMRQGPLANRLSELLSGKRYVETLEELVNERHEQKELVMRSALFVFVWGVMALLAATSVKSELGRGFILGIGLHLLFDLASDYIWDKLRFNLWFWQIKRELPKTEKDIFMGLAMIGMVLLSFIL